MSDPSLVKLAALRARDAWERSGRPGAESQLPLFEEHRFAVPEVVAGRAADRPRRKRKRR
jgi:hypothetical protein